MNKPIKTKKDKVLVFGANGFLGSVITRKLYASGYDVEPVVRPRADITRLSGIENLKILEVEPENWLKLVVSNAPDTVVCAQWQGVSKQDRDDLDLQKSNIKPILSIALAAKESGVRNFICFGSLAEVRESLETIKEEFYDSGESAYGRTKANLHEQLILLLENSDCRFIWARVFSVYGPSDFSDSLLSDLFESEMVQNDLDISNPSKFWSFLYEDDFASAIEELLKNSNIANTVNVGSPIFSEIREVVSKWQGLPLANHRTYRSGQSDIGFFPQLEKLQSIGWSPSVSLEEGIQRTREALRDRFNSR
jgi:UDP-glucose 4-epimerase